MSEVGGGEDRGGLIYPIEVIDRFSAGLAAFTSGLDKVQTRLGEVQSLASKFKSIKIPAIPSSDAATVQSYKKALNDIEKARIKQASDTNKKLTTELDAASEARAAAIRRDIQAKSAAVARENQIIENGLRKSQARDEADLKRYESYAARRAKIASDAAEKIADFQNRQAITNADRERMAVNKGIQQQFRERVASQDALSNELKTAQAQATKRATKDQEDQQRRILSIMRDKVEAEKNLNALIKAGVNPTSLSEKELKRAGLFSSKTGIAPKSTGQINEELASTRPKSIQDRIKDIIGLSNANASAESSGSRLLFTFRRLFGVLAAFTIIRTLTQQFFELVKSTIGLNAELETARLGIASLILASGAVKDSTGGSLNNMQGLAIATKAAQRQMTLLRRDALQTSGTFRDLLDAFQQGIAPGLEAGLNLDQIREFTVRISQAASALGQPQNQLPEEIRSILSGNISQRTTRIASALGITPDDIRQAKQAGTLFEFLQKKFGAFAAAGVEANKTFNVLFSNLQDGIQQAVASGGLSFFENLKNLVSELFDVVNQRNSLGDLRINPVVIAAIGLIAVGLDNAVSSARDLMSSLTPKQVLNLAATLGQVLTLVATLTAGIVQGLIAGVSDIYDVLHAVSGVFGGIANIDLQQLVAQITRIAVVVLSVQAAMSTINALILLGNSRLLASLISWNKLGAALGLIQATLIKTYAIANLSVSANGITGIFTKLSLGGKSFLAFLPALWASIKAISISLYTWMLPIAGVALLMGTVVGAFAYGMRQVGRFAKEINGITLSFGQMFSVLKESVLGTVAIFLVNISAAGKQVVNQISLWLTEAKNTFSSGLLAILEIALHAASILPGVGDAAAAALKKVQDTRIANDNAVKNQIAALKKGSQDIENARVAAGAALQQQLTNNTGNIYDQARLQQAKEDIGGLAEALQSLPESIGSARDPLSANVELMKGLRDELDGAVNDLRIYLQTQGSSAEVAATTEAIAKNEFEYRKDIKKLAEETQAEEARRDAILTKQEKNRNKISSLSEHEKQVVEEINNVYQKQINAEKKLNDLKQSRAELEIQRQQSNEKDKAALVIQIARADELISLQKDKLNGINDEQKGMLAGVENAGRIRDLAIEQLDLQDRAKTSAGNIVQLEADRNRLLIERVKILDTVVRRANEEATFRIRQDTQAARSHLAQSQIVADAETSIQSLRDKFGDVGISESVLRDLANIEARRKEINFEIEQEKLGLLANAILTAKNVAYLTVQGSSWATITSEINKFVALQGASLTKTAEHNLALAEQDRLLKDIAIASVEAARQQEIANQSSAQQLKGTIANLDIRKQIQSIREAFGSLPGASQALQDIVEITNKRGEISLQLDQENKLYASQKGFADGLLKSLEDQKNKKEQYNAILREQSALDEAHRLKVDQMNVGLAEQVLLVEQLRNDSRDSQQNLNRENEIAAIRNITSLRLEAAAGARDEVKDVISSQGAYDEIKATIQQEIELTKQQQQAFQATLELLKSRGAPLEYQNQLLAEQASREEQSVQSIQEKNIALQTQGRLLRENVTKAGNDIKDVPNQLALAFSKIEVSLPSQFEQILDAMRSLIDGFSSFISDSIVDAFDPGKDTTIQERLASFLRDFAKQIIDTLVKIAVIKSIAFAFGANEGGSVETPQIPAFNGGSGQVRGYAAGGKLVSIGRPKNIHPSDTIPAWLSPGEWVIRARAVLKYGHEAMSALNAGLVDPLALQSLISVGRGNQASQTSTGPGYASGGLVTDRLSDQRKDSGVATTTIVREILPVVAGNDQTLSTLLTGGEAALLDFFESRKQKFRSILNV